MKPTAFSELGRRTNDPPISWLMKMTLDRPELISLAAGFTDDISLPVKETQALLARILASPKVARATLQYGATNGDPRLRRLTAERLRIQDRASANDASYSTDKILITHGSQQLLYLITECLCNAGDIVLVEDPTYFVYLGILQSHGLRCRGIALESDGLNLERLEAVLESLKRAGELPRVKMLYLVTYFQNPSGVTTSLAKKAAALDLLRRYERHAGHPIYLLEDAAYRDLRFSGPDIPSALTLARNQERVIYAGTYSKPFATGIRVGYGRLPAEVFKVAARVKGNHDFGTSNLLQQVLVQALISGLYADHLAMLQKRYKKKARAMLTALEEHFPEQVQWLTPTGGLYVWAQLPRKIKSGPKSRLFRTALAHDVLYVPGELCYGPDSTRQPAQNEMRLSFGSASEQNIRRGIARLGEVAKELIG
jgi:2-aminoadipate transaminase